MQYTMYVHVHAHVYTNGGKRERVPLPDEETKGVELCVSVLGVVGDVGERRLVGESVEAPEEVKEEA